MKENVLNRKMLTQKIKQSLLSCLLVIFFAFQGQQSMAQFVTANGTKILDPSGDELFFTGINLGNWLLWEGYLMMGDFNYRTHTQFLNSLTEAFGNDVNKALEFEHQWRLNYVTEQAIIDLKGLGYNSVRVPFHYNMFYDDETGQLRDHGFQYFDRLIDWCKTHEMYILLDMHAAPGYQNPGDHSDNMDSNAQQPRETVMFFDEDLVNVTIAADVWRHIAAYYVEETIIWGFDLINEPVLQVGREYELLTYLKIMRDAIREVNNNHIVVAEGSWWGSNMHTLDWTHPWVQGATGITEPWDDKLVYQTHHYISDISGIAALDGRLAICNALNVPMINGEYGEAEMHILKAMTDWHLANDVGYFPWSFKKMSHDRCLWTIQPNAAYNELKNFINSGGSGTPRAGLYDDMISFAQNNIANGATGLVWHQPFYDAVRNTSIPVVCNTIVIPGIVEAENYCAMQGIQRENTMDIGGGQNVGWIDAGDWLEYTVDVAAAGTYFITARVASENETGSFYIAFDGDDKTGVISVPNTDGWQVWADVVRTGITLSAGEQTMRIRFTGGGFNLNKITFTSGAGVSVAGVSVSPVEVSIPVFGNQQLTATISPSNASNKFVSWSSSNASVASVNSSGIVTGVSAGSATITATTQDGNRTATCAVTVASTPASNLPGYYNILSVHSEKGLEVANNATTSGANIHQWEVPTGGGDNQSWGLDELTGGYYRIRVKSTQLCLALTSNSTANGTNVVQQTCNTTNRQQWTVNSLGNDHYVIINRYSNKALDVAGVSADNGANIQVWDYTGSNNQKWTFSMVEDDKIASALDSPTNASGKFEVYPNPAQDHVVIRSSDMVSHSRIRVYSILGVLMMEEVVSADANELRINLQGLQSGIYIIEMLGDQDSVKRRILKN